MKPTYGGTLVFSFLCSGLPLYHNYTDTSLIRQDSECLSLYSEFQRTKINGSRKSSLYWLGHLAANYQRSGKHFLKTALIYLQKKLSFSYLVQKISFQVVAVENALFMSAFAIIDNLFTFHQGSIGMVVAKYTLRLLFVSDQPMIRNLTVTGVCSC